MADHTDKEVQQALNTKKGMSAIIEHYKGFVVLASSSRDLGFKKSSIDRGDTDGFITIKDCLHLPKDKVSKYATDEFPWTQADMDPEDLTCIIDGYTLRVEKLDDKKYWWAVYFEDHDLSPNKLFELNIDRAIGLAEGTYFGHSLASAYNKRK